MAQHLQRSDMRSGRASTGSVGISGASNLVTITWVTPFDDTSYTTSVTMQSADTSALGLTIVHVESQTASAIQVRVTNNTLGALTGTIHAMAIHD